VVVFEPLSRVIVTVSIIFNITRKSHSNTHSKVIRILNSRASHSNTGTGKLMFDKRGPLQIVKDSIGTLQQNAKYTYVRAMEKITLLVRDVRIFDSITRNGTLYRSATHRYAANSTM